MPRRTSPVTVDTRELERFASRLDAARKDVPRQLKKDLAESGKLVVAQARRNASWSKRIPRTILMRESGTGRVAGAKATAAVYITVGGKSAPHARVFEPADQRRVVSHPVYGRPDRTRRQWAWVKQRTRPYVRPAFEQVRAQILTKIQDGQVRNLRRNLGA